MLKKIDHIAIVVSDLEGAKDFFLSLGFTVVRGAFLPEIPLLRTAKAVLSTLPGGKTSFSGTLGSPGYHHSYSLDKSLYQLVYYG